MITPISYDENKNQTLVEAIPLTGRQHQIRVHLDSIGHSIIGDTLYGVDVNFANDFLNKKISNENGEIIDFIIKNHDRTPKGKLLSFGSKSPVRKWLSSKGSNSNPPNLKSLEKSLLEINGDE